jgi:hypothetical protein
LTRPPLPTCARPTSNCGFTSTSASAPPASTASSGGSSFITEMNDTSITASEHGSGTSSGESRRALVFSSTTTRGSARSRSCSCARPTSTA